MGFLGFGDDSTDDAQEYLDKIGPMLHEQYDPYRNAGLNALPTLEEQYAMLLSNPASMQQMLGNGYQQSPGYQYQYDQAMNGANSAAAAGGLLGTQGHQQYAANTATGLANQDYWNYYNQNADLYKMGLQGTQGLFDTGYDATNQLASGLGNMYGSQANLAYTSGKDQNDMIASLLGIAGGVAGSMLAPGAGTDAGASLGYSLGGGGGGNSSGWMYSNPETYMPIGTF